MKPATDMKRVCPVCGRNVYCLILRETEHDGETMTITARTICPECRTRELAGKETK